jgi:hypothetical protein
MMQVNAGFRSPEDIKKTILNPNPSSEQMAPNEYVDRIRRIQLNDLEICRFSWCPEERAERLRAQTKTTRPGIERDELIREAPI